MCTAMCPVCYPSHTGGGHRQAYLGKLLSGCIQGVWAVPDGRGGVWCHVVGVGCASDTNWRHTASGSVLLAHDGAAAAAATVVAPSAHAGRV